MMKEDRDRLRDSIGTILHPQDGWLPELSDSIGKGYLRGLIRVCGAAQALLDEVEGESMTKDDVRADAETRGVLTPDKIQTPEDLRAWAWLIQADLCVAQQEIKALQGRMAKIEGDREDDFRGPDR